MYKTDFTNDRSHSLKQCFYQELVQHLETNVKFEKHNLFPKTIKWQLLPNYTVPSTEIIKLVDCFNMYYPKSLQQIIQNFYLLTLCKTEDDVAFVFNTATIVIAFLKAYMDLYKICNRYVKEPQSVQVLQNIRNICRSVAFKCKYEVKRLLGTYPDFSYPVEQYYDFIKRELVAFV